MWKTQCLIDGKWVGELVDHVFDPATGDELGSIPHLDATEAHAAVDAAHRALAGWSSLLAKDRSKILRAWYELILQHRQELAALLTSEQGKPLTEALAEIDYAAGFVEFYAEEARRIYGETIPSHRADARIFIWKQPIGVCAAITPWNFPAAMVTRKVAPALAAGCTVVLKPAPETPLTALALAELAVRANFPPGTLNVITGDAVSIGRAWCDDPRVRSLSFTGSTEVGKLLMRQCADTVKRVSLELGGNAPFIVFDDADIEAAADGAVAAKFRNMGQTCICANRLFVQEGVHDEFVTALVERVGRLQVGDGREPGVTQGPLINREAVEKVEEHLADAVALGAHIRWGGQHHPLGRTFFEPTVLEGVTPEMRIFREETFGPLAPVIRFADEKEVLELANAVPSGLAGYFYGRDIGRVIRVAERLQVGMVAVNTPALSNEAAPFGGVKESGLGREGGRQGIEEFLELKYVLLGGL
ncbi:MAG: succinate-semialdehyde dehydrogenase (NADP(+)) [Planctomycetales bacterium 12-60-4]|nr:MAG: succinate-semialdehyde dehydrogenase (NADP(+)) [Planctomycetales bacterium 12-60-4]